MKRILAGLLLISTGALAQAPDKAAPQPPLKLWRLDCGRLDENKERPWGWQKVPTPTPCFLIGNGNRYLLWDAGMTKRAIGANHPVAKLERTITDQLTQIGVRPEQIEFIGISHYHGDHTGQATQFPKAKLLIGAGDFEALKSKTPPGGAAPDAYPAVDRRHFAGRAAGRRPRRVRRRAGDDPDDPRPYARATARCWSSWRRAR